MNKQERLEAINKLIEFISERGRQFFRTKVTVAGELIEIIAEMKLINGRVYYIDPYTKKQVTVRDTSIGWDGFSSGGTLRSLVLDFADFIRTGKDTNGNHGYGGLYATGWGHSEEVQKEIIDYAKEIGYLKYEIIQQSDH
ncbi:MAG: hypothetical protein ABS944_16230 [Solibacillus sp.]|uniref:hypothetical protein n=1 Tax=Solibacillus sp. TaxID=1909654 RepID=UPI003315880B